MKAQENPFVGVRAIEDKDRFFGRDHELRRLTSLLIAERIVLFYSPSGAGKTSLLKAGLIPKLKAREFIVHPVMRVGAIVEWPDSASAVGCNRYLKSALNDLGIAPSSPGAGHGEKNFSDYLKELLHDGDVSQPEVFIFDQFEEILTCDQLDLDRKQEFFDQVGKALQDQHRWAVFAMREDYIARLDPYLRHLPTRLATTFRLNFLSRDAAIEAVQETAEAAQKKEGLTSLPDNIPPGMSRSQLNYFFGYAAVSKLVDNLSGVLIPKIENAAGGGGSPAQKIRGQYVEPVHLQVVCKRLWKSLPGQTGEIKPQDIEDFGDVDTSLEDYYSEEIKVVADMTKAGEQREIREWFDRRLITHQGLRTQVMLTDADTQRLGGQTISNLLDSYLVRADERHDNTWLELSHDRLINPVRCSNEKWFKRELSLLELRARAWDDVGRPSSLLLAGEEWDTARRWAEGKLLNGREESFYAECEKAANAEQVIDKLRRNLWLALFLFLLAITGAVVTWGWAGEKIAEARRKTEEAEKKTDASSKREKDVEEWAKATISDANKKAKEAIDEANNKAKNAAEDAEIAKAHSLRAREEADEKARQAREEADEIARQARKEADGKARQAREEADEKARQAISEAKAAADRDVEAANKEADKLKVLIDARNMGLEAMKTLGDDPTGGVALELKAIDLLLRHNSTTDKDVRESLGERLAELQQLLPATLLEHNIHDCNGPDCEPGNIQSLGFSANGQWLVTASDNGKAYKYDLSKYNLNGSNFQEEFGIWYRSEVSQVAVSPNTGHVAVGYSSGDVKIWDLNDHQGVPIKAFRYPVHQLMFGGDEGLLASASKFWTYSVGELKLSDSPKMRRLYLKPSWLDWLWGVWIKARSSRLISDFAFVSKAGSTLLMAAREDGQLEVREARSGKEVLTARLFAKQQQRKADKALEQRAKDKSPKQGGVGKNKAEERVKSDGWAPPRDMFLHIATSPDGHWLATAGKDGIIYVWDILDLWNKHDPKISFSKRPIACEPATPTRAGAIQSMTFSPESNVLASAGQDNAIRLWKLSNSECNELLSHPIPGHKGTINTLVFNTEPRHKRLRLASADSTGTTKIWRISLSQVQKLNDLQDELRARRKSLIDKPGAANSANKDMGLLLESIRQFIER